MLKFLAGAILVAIAAVCACAPTPASTVSTGLKTPTLSDPCLLGTWTLTSRTNFFDFYPKGPTSDPLRILVHGATGARYTLAPGGLTVIDFATTSQPFTGSASGYSIVWKPSGVQRAQSAVTGPGQLTLSGWDVTAYSSTFTVNGGAGQTGLPPGTGPLTVAYTCGGGHMSWSSAPYTWAFSKTG